MTPLDKVEGRAIPFGLKNVDTDVIIPAHWLKTTTREGMGRGAFESLRADPDNLFDSADFKGAPILIAPIMLPIEIISHLSRVLSLTLRLFGNIFGEHLVVLILASIVPFIAPLPIQNFVEGRKEILLGTEVQLTQDMVGQIGYQWFTGGTRYTNLRSDRDNLAISLTYTF